MKREGFILVYRDVTELYAMDDAMLCTGTTVANLKEVVKHFERRPVKWYRHDDFFGRRIWVGAVTDAEIEEYDTPAYIIYPIKPPETWKLVK